MQHFTKMSHWQLHLLRLEWSLSLYGISADAAYRYPTIVPHTIQLVRNLLNKL